jgi:hypothetical protein
MKKSELRLMIRNILKEELIASSYLTESDFSENTEVDFKKGFIEYILKNDPGAKPGCDLLYQFDFKKSSGTITKLFDIEKGIIELPAFIMDEHDYYKAFEFIWREITKLRRFTDKLNTLEDAYIAAKE